MLRLLYMLARQRFNGAEWRQERAAPRRPRPRHRRLFTGIALAVAGVGAVLVLGQLHLLPVPTLSDYRQVASLRLHVTTVHSAPVVIYLKSPRTVEQPTGAPRPVMVRINSVNSTFEPRFQVAPLSATIEVTNGDPIPHNTHVFDGNRTIFNVATPVPGVRVRKILSQPGMLGVRCDLHPWMQAWVFVPANPHYAVFWQPGSVTLRDIPAGEYRVYAWQASRGERVLDLSLGSGEIRSVSYPDS